MSEQKNGAGLAFAGVAGFLSVQLAAAFTRYGGLEGFFKAHGITEFRIEDVVGFAALGLILFWCLWKRSPKSGSETTLNAPGHEDPRQSLAFRLGQSLNRVLYGGRRSPVVRNDAR